MKFCDACGAANEEYASVCYACGAALPGSEPVGKKKGSFSIPKPVLIIGAAVLAVALIVGCIFLVLSGNETDIASAYDRTRAAFEGDSAGQTQLEKFLDQANGYLKVGDYTIYLSYSGSTQLELQTDYARGDKQLQGTITTMGLQLAYSADNKVMQFSVPGQFDNVYGFKLSQAEKLTENPVLGYALQGANLDLDFDFFATTDLETYFEGIAGEEYEAFLDSVEIKELDEQALGGEKCKVYEITWSSEASNKLISAVGSLGTLPQIGSLVNALTPELEPECRCYVNSDGYLVGLDFVSAGAQCLLVLEGEDNPWDAFSLTVNSVYGETLYYTGALERNGDAMRVYLSGESGTLVSLDYDNASGAFALYTEDHGQLLKGQVTAGGSEAKLTLEWDAGEAGVQQVTLVLSELENKPRQLSENYIDLLDMSISDLTRLMLDLGIQIG